MSAFKNKIYNKPTESWFRCKNMSRKEIGGKLNRFLKALRIDRNLLGPIVVVKAGVVSSG